MKHNIRIECVSPTQTLTEDKEYVPDQLIRENGRIIVHGVEWDEATHVILKNDRGKSIRTLTDRFKKVDE